MQGASSLVTLRDEMRRFVIERVQRLVTRFCPDFRIPGTFAGHRIRGDHAAELAWMLGLLKPLGVHEINGVSSVEALRRLLLRIRGDEIRTFYSFRVAEAVQSFGGWHDNPALAGMSDAERRNVANAADSTSCYDRAADRLKHANNYWAVLARCELRRVQLGLVDRQNSLLPLSLERTSALLAASETGHFDDDPEGAGTFDIYSPDVVLFLEPLWTQLDPALLRRAQLAANELVQTTAMENGACVGWGRSIGAHSVALTAEWCAAALRLGMSGDPARSLGLARNAFEKLRDEWFADDLISAHRGRQPFGYRGTHRLFQMTLDILSKLLFAADQLDRATVALGATVPALGPSELFPRQDRFIRFETDRGIGVWLYRNGRIAFQLPVVFGTRADYFSFPRAPGLLANPVDSTMVVASPRVWIGDCSYATCGPAAEIEKRPDGLRLVFDEFRPLEDPKQPALKARREVTWRVRGDVIEADERWTFDERLPDAIALDIAETEKRPLFVEIDAATPTRRSTVVTRDMPGYRSYFDTLARWHQAEIEPARSMRVRWSVRPALRVAHVPNQHDYNRALYDAMCADGRVVECGFEQGRCGHQMEALRDLLRDADVLHVGWPEHLFALHGLSDEQFDTKLREQLEWLKTSGRKVVWTQHNRLPHGWTPERGAALYRMWAPVVDGVIHHSRWGMELMRAELPYRPTCRHVVIPHGHFGAQMPRCLSRAQLEAKYGIPPTPIRVGLLGRTQATKQGDLIVQAFIEAAGTRDDLQLLAVSRPKDESLLNHRHVVSLPRPAWVTRQTIAEHTQLCDALVIAHTGPTYLTSGMPADAIGLGLAMIVNDWGYFREHLGDAALYHDNTTTGLARVFASLTRESVREYGLRAAALQERYAWPTIAAQTRDFLLSLMDG